jgi:hypothetical protein
MVTKIDKKQLVELFRINNYIYYYKISNPKNKQILIYCCKVTQNNFKHNWKQVKISDFVQILQQYKLSINPDNINYELPNIELKPHNIKND